MSAMKEVRRQVLRLYGNLVSVDEPRFNLENKLWIAQLKVDYPRIIRDDSTNERFLKFLSMENVGRIYLKENLQLKEATEREECIKRIKSFLAIWRQRAERIITYASSDKLARVSEARYVFSPIMQIISNFLQKDSMSHEEIHAARGDRLKQYLRLLEGLDLATETEDGYTYGNLFTELLDRLEDVEEIRIAILSHVIRERYSTLRDVFRTHQFDPYVNMNSCYYKPALEAERLLYRKPDTIIAAYRTVYRSFPTIKLHHFVQSLAEAGALHRKGRYLYGDENLFSKMLEMKQELPVLTSPAADKF